MAQRINLPTSAAYNFPLNLEGVAVYLRIYWNTRTEGWYLDVFDEDSVAIERGVRMEVNQPLVLFGLENWSLDGNLYVAPTTTESEITDEGQKITRDNFGGTRNYQLFYVPSSEYTYFLLQ